MRQKPIQWCLIFTPTNGHKLKKKKKCLLTFSGYCFHLSPTQNPRTSQIYLHHLSQSHAENQRTFLLEKYLSTETGSVQLLSCVRVFVTPWIAACQASLSITNSRSSPRLTSVESVMPSSHVILCRPLLLLPPIPPSIRVLSNESTLRVRWPKYWSFSFSISPSKEHPGLILLQNPSLSSESYSKFTLSHLICSNLL